MRRKAEGGDVEYGERGELRDKEHAGGGLCEGVREGGGKGKGRDPETGAGCE